MKIEKFTKRMMELLPQLAKGLLHREHDYLTRGRMTIPQFWALDYLARHGRSKMSAIARFLDVSKPAATSMIERLVAQRFVKRLHDTRDRRIVWIEITPKGRALIQKIWNQKRRKFAELFGNISPAERAQYLNILEKVARTIGASRDT